MIREIDATSLRPDWGLSAQHRGASDAVPGAISTAIDVPGSADTTATIAVEEIVHGRIDGAGDHDWIRLELPLGSGVYTLQALASGDHGLLADTTLTLRDANGVAVSFDDDGGDSPYLSSITFSAVLRVFATDGSSAFTNVVYVDVGGSGDTRTGDYHLSLTAASDGLGSTAWPLWSNDQVASFLPSPDAFWDGASRHFDVTTGGTLKVRFDGLFSDEGAAMAREALALWTDVTGIAFLEVSEGEHIAFREYGSGGFMCSDVHSGGITSSAQINFDTSLYTLDNGTEPGGYCFTAAVHEIGHALGLGHGGPYNVSGSYPGSALYANDSWVVSVMSYFDQSANHYFSSRGFAYSPPVTPMAADILATTALYGAWNGTRTGDTTYGFNSNAGRDIFDATLLGNAATYAIVDHGGVDTLDYSGFVPAAGGVQTIVLKPEAFSRPGYDGAGGQVVIARGSVIENAIGGAGVDSISGNDVDNVLDGLGGNDWLHGMEGDDLLRGGRGDDTLVGGTGNDVYVVGEIGDVVIEHAGGGSDTVRTTLAVHRLESDVENLAGQAATGQQLTGNALANVIRGAAGDDRLAGLVGADRLTGGAGIDVLSGGTHDDVLHGGAGADTMRGGTGDDVYHVDDTGDLVFEAASAGADVVRAGIDYVLPDAVEVLFIVATGLDGSGNALANTLHGSARGNMLAGLAGDDVLRGGIGRDTLLGGDGDDVLDGGTGRDALTGGGGRDRFQFRDGDMQATRVLADTITDFSHADFDKILLSRVDANTALAGDQAFAFIGSGAFTGVAGQLHYARQGDRTYVEGDTDGDGTADFVIALTGTLTLVAGDFVL